MADELARRAEQERAADALAKALESVALPMALSRDRLPLNAASPEQVDLGKALVTLSRRIPGFVARIVPGEVQAEEWSTLGRVLKALGAECRRAGERPVVVEVDDRA